MRHAVDKWKTLSSFIKIYHHHIIKNLKSKKKTAVEKFLIRHFMNLIQTYNISQDIWEKIFPLNSICLTSKVAFPFVILCELVFVISTTDV